MVNSKTPWLFEFKLVFLFLSKGEVDGFLNRCWVTICCCCVLDACCLKLWS
ncbi:BnaCnng46400D [Brassica napus]|uniref:BnaCnng46400D protein n=1 Tax=Brassica napus TaxID=3708 RepID=A0A078JFQ5_BRANA|nr:BnaCnng46400D [Brassica napus]